MNRFVGLILIVGVLLCTFSCTAGNCCAVTPAVTAAAQPLKSCCSHCRQEARLPADPDRSDSPNSHDSQQSPNPEACVCQGACSGMIRGESVQITDASDWVWFSRIVEPLVVTGCSGLVVSALDGLPDPGMTHGLAMRLRFCSLTC